MTATSQPASLDPTDRNDAIKLIRAALKQRSGKAWSVTGGVGSSWGWIRISVPPSRRIDGHIADEDCAELGQLLGFDMPVPQGHVSVPASSAYRREYVDRAEGRTPSVVGTPYWD